MKKNSLEYIIPASVALLVTVLLIRFIPLFSESYLIDLEDTQERAQDDFNYYYDLNGDGFSELFSIYYNTSGNLAVSVASLSNATINQFNLPGSLTELGPLFDLHDIDQDGVVDIFVCTEKNDSLFLSIIDDLYGHPTRTREFYLDPINQYNDMGDYLFVSGELSDLTGDGYPEYIFAVNGGHALQPRRVYAIDYMNNRVMRSPESGAAIISLDLFDLDRDGRDEILLNTVAPENFKSPVPYRDSVTWMMVLDRSLQFYRPPEAMNHAPSWISMEPYVEGGDHYLMTYHRYPVGNEYQATLAIYDDSLRVVRSRIFTGKMRRCYLWRTEGGMGIRDIKLLCNNGIYTVDTSLNIVDSLFNREPFGYDVEVFLDLDDDGEDEYVFVGGSRIHVFRADLSESAELGIRLNDRAPRILISVVEEGDNYPVLFVQTGREQYFLRYYRNNWFRLRGLLYPGIYLMLFGLLYLWVILQNRIISSRYEKDRLISQLQLQSIRNQLDPHFTYNALNAVGSLIYKGEKELAYRYLKGLTDLLRMVSRDSGEVTWTLSSELDFVVKYLEIEKLRFRERFNFGLSIQEEKLEDLLVPKMSLLTFVENAVKHGLRHKEDDRRIDIRATRIKNGIQIEIEDNGIGRAAASELQNESAGNGIEMMTRYFREFNEATGNHASFRVEDLYKDDNSPAGTLIKINIDEK